MPANIKTALFSIHRERKIRWRSPSTEAIFPGFEKGIIGTTIGRSKTITLDAVKAYWQMSDDPAIDVEKKEIPYNINPSVGLNLHMRQHFGKVVNLVVSRVADETLTLDADYQLAGKNRIFDIELLEIA